MRKKKSSDLKLPNFTARFHSPKSLSNDAYVSFVDFWLSQIDPKNSSRSHNFIVPVNNRFKIL